MVRNDLSTSARRRKGLLYGIGAFVVLFLLYHSFYVTPLDERMGIADDADVQSLMEEYVQITLPEVLEQAPAPCVLMKALAETAGEGWDTYGKQTNIGTRYFFLMRGEGEVVEISDSFITVAFGSGESSCVLRIATVYIFGNEVRDASGQLLLRDVGDISKFNALSEKINANIRDSVIPDFMEQVEVGSRIHVDGAFSLNRKVSSGDNLEVMPIHLRIIK